ncbi:cation:proton antiporter [Sulfuritalea hydrogenivorans]|uniref:Sodium/hydrogen exchanger n=1 Tax=Sulfuritalea hydrogenivorans sk43H TaxID=1223802 RepID=W0SEA3_9PROT|nr:cation:proton antiporter [Sulfuritalea hydrogenivorans]BAO29559.1 sodium/hydrogen exchanger [Sulfuritalea hydrogenivorans sk43H]
MHGVFSEFALLLLMSATAGAFFLWLRQPVLIAYIVIGIVAGPAVLGVVTAHDQIDLLAQVGVAVLLFVVGLKLDLQHIRHIGPVALATGLGQLAFTIVIGFLIILAMGKGWMEALYVAVALTFSSTIIIVKLLSDKREIDSLHGRIAVGFLIVQDLAVVIAMMVMSALRGGGDEASLLALAGSLSLRLGVAAVGMYLLMRYVMPRVVDRMAQSQELLLIFAIAWGTGLATLGEWAGFSKEAGAFLAGFSLASTHYRDAINARLTGIRDFLLLFFFIDLGAKLDFSTLGGEVGPAVALSLFVLIGNPLIVMAIMGYMGYRKRTGFLCGLTVAQISEFSIIFVAMGISLGHVDNGALGLTTLVGLITIALSTYLILYSHPLYEKLAPWLGVFERKRPYRELAVAKERHDLREADVIVFGLGRYGSRLALGLKEAELKVLGVEFDPEVARSMRRQGLPVRYGDGIASEFLESLPLKDTRWVVSTLPDLASNRDLLRGLRELHFTGEVAVVAREEFDGTPLKALGTPTILYPMRNAVDYAVDALTAIIRNKETPS